MTPGSRRIRFFLLMEELKSHIGRDVDTGRKGCFFSVYPVM